MTNEQCIQIAEKIWGWKKDTDTLGFTTWSGGITLHAISTLKREVNSWQGFGRTVEALSERGWDFGADDGVVLFQRDHGNQVHESFYVVSPFKKEQFIEATHLAALEVKKDDKS